MESVGQPRPSGACSLLGVPDLSILDLDEDDDEGEVVIGIRPKSSPLPRRRSSLSDQDSEPEPPMCGSRRVSFADAKGLSLVQVKEFGTWDVPKPPGYDSFESEGKDREEYFLSPLTFSLPLPTEELFRKVREQKIELETIELLPGTTILKGVIRVLNISFSKTVFVRTTLDTWSSHFDLLAEYIPGSGDGLMDCFSFKLTLVPPFGEAGARVDFCLRYETSVGTFWANNNNSNYILFCHERVKERQEKPQEKPTMNKKSCLKNTSQNFSSVESITAKEASSQENISTDVTKQIEKVDTTKIKQISDSQSGTSEEERQKLQTENRRNSSRRNRRKAARMARVRDHFARRGEGENETEREESPPEAKQAAPEETPEEKHTDVQSFSNGTGKLESSQFVTASLKTCSEMKLAHDYTTAGQPEKSESINLADLATLTGGESATDIKDNLLHLNDETNSTGRQNINESVSKAEESSHEGVSYECPGNITAEPADSVISDMCSESLVSKTDSFTFGTVMAPLYHQVSSRVASESQSVGDWVNPVQATLNAGDLTQSYPHTEQSETSCTVQTGAGGNNDKEQGNVIATDESRQECTRAITNSHPCKEGKTSLTANDILEQAESLQNPVLTSDQRCTNTSEAPTNISEDTVIHPHANIVNTDSLNPQISTESLNLQRETQEVNLFNDLLSQTRAETAQAQLLICTCTRTEPNFDQISAQSETEEVLTSLETASMSLQPGALLLDKQTSCCGSNNTTCEAQISLEIQEETNNLEEENKDAMMSNYHILSDTFVELKDKDTLKYEEVIVSEIIEHHEIEAAVSEHDDFCVVDTTELKNWEMMVEEEERNILTDEEESKEISPIAKDIKAVRRDQEEQLKNARTEKTSENLDTTEVQKESKGDEILGEVTAARESEDRAEDADVLEERKRIGEEKIEEIVAAKDMKVVTKELEHVPVSKTAQEEEVAEACEVEEGEEKEATASEREKQLAEIQEGNTEIKNNQEEEEIEWEEEMEIDLNDDNDYDDDDNDDDGGEADVEWKEQVEPKEENKDEESLDYEEEIPADEMRESETVDAQSETMTVGDREHFEERLDITQNKVEDCLSVLVNSVQDKRVNDKENIKEGKNADIPTQMHFYKEEHFQSHENVTHNLSKDAEDETESTAVEEGSCTFMDEPESDQLSLDGSSAESDSDDEVELYMHCFRAVHAGAQAQKDRNKDTGFSVGKRLSLSKSKLLSTPMPSISESLDEETNLGSPLDDHEDMEALEFQPIAAAQPESSGQESINRNVSWWIETFSCSNISKMVLYATLLVVFVVFSYHYDFLACFGLYLVSVIWLCCQGERQSV